MPPKKEETSSTKKAPAKKTAPKKTSPQRKTSSVKAAATSSMKAAVKTPSTLEKIVEADHKATSDNTRHIEENTQDIANNSRMIHTLYGIIVALLILIGVLAFFVGKTMWGGVSTGPKTVSVDGAGVEITVIDDTRCTDCQTDSIIEQIQAAPFLAKAEIVKKDFSDAGVAKMLEENGITALPALIFNTNLLNDGGQLSPALIMLQDGSYSLNVGGTFNPFEERSDKGYLMLDDATFQTLKDTAHYAGNTQAPITWIEFSDVNCLYCKKMHAEDKTPESVMAEFGDQLNHNIINFIWVGGEATQVAAEILECAGSVGGSELYNSLFVSALVEAKNTPDDLYAFAQAQGADVDAIKSCYESGESKDIVAQKFALGTDVFGIGGTPGNVILNNETKEYTIISGAYPAETFIEAINTMLGK